MHGHGELVLPSGETYKGLFRDGVYHGAGERTWPSGEFICLGGCVPVYVCLYMLFRYVSTIPFVSLPLLCGSDADIPSYFPFYPCLFRCIFVVYATIGDRFVGEFRHGKAEGHGQLSSSQGWVYIGKWQAGKVHAELCSLFACCSCLLLFAGSLWLLSILIFRCLSCVCFFLASVIFSFLSCLFRDVRACHAADERRGTV
jgi:hypothetical protein